MKRMTQNLKWIVMLCAMMVCNGAWAQMTVWEKTNPGNLVTGDVVVITGPTSDNKAYAIGNETVGGDFYPTAIELAVQRNNTLLSGSAYIEKINKAQWEVEKNGDNFHFKVPETNSYLSSGSVDTKLYVKETGSIPEEIEFQIFNLNDVDYLVKTGYGSGNVQFGPRFVCINSTKDWYFSSSDGTYIPSSESVAITVYKKITTEIIIDDTRITNKDVSVSTEAGSFSATVKENGSELENADVSWSSSNQSVATIDNNGFVTLVDAGETTITASYQTNYGMCTAEYKLTVTKPQPSVVSAVLNNAFFGTNYNGVISSFSPNPVSGTKYGVTIEYGGRAVSQTTFYIDDVKIGFSNDNTLTFKAPEGYYLVKIAFTRNTSWDWHCTIRSDVGTITDNDTWEGKSKTVKLTGSAGGTSYMSVVEITLASEGEEVTVEGTLGAGKYATRIFPFAPTAIQGVTFYNCIGVNGNALSIEEVSAPEANTPYILGNETTDDIDITQTGADNHQADTYESASGLLVGTFVNMAVSSGYVLQTQNGKQAFYKVDSANPITMIPYRAYLNYSAEIKALGFDDATAINALDALTSGAYEGIYSVDGVKLNRLEKGVNILKMADGSTRKVIVK